MVYADAVGAGEQLSPNGDEAGFCWCARRFIWGALYGRFRVWQWQGLIIDFAIVCLRQGIQQDVVGRYHPVWQGGGKLAAPVGVLSGGFVFWHNEGNEAGVAGLGLKVGNGRFLHIWQHPQGGFNFPKLNARPTNFHLPVIAPQMDQTAIFHHFAQIARVEKAAGRILGGLPEFFGRESRVLPIALSQVRAAHNNLPNLTSRNGAVCFIDQKDIFVRHSIANRQYAIFGQGGVVVDEVAAVGGNFTGAEIVQQGTGWREMLTVQDYVGLEDCFTPKVNKAHVVELLALRHGLHEVAENGWHSVEDGDFFLLKPGGHVADAVGGEVVWVEGGAIEQGAEGVAEAGLVVDPGQLADVVLGVDVEGVGVQPDVVQDGFVGVNDAFWFAGGAGGEDDVRRGVVGDGGVGCWVVDGRFFCNGLAAVDEDGLVSGQTVCHGQVRLEGDDGLWGNGRDDGLLPGSG